ncbi:MAG TPA: hypothetical protein VGR37_15920 [Longimicrobiaceae bacterium]|nr:hypothetical protein [Longimicrobiaceae bacterium]
MAQIREEAVRAGAAVPVAGDPAAAAVEFLRRELSEEVQDQFREVIRVDALGALDAIVGRVVQQMLRCNGFTERVLGVESLGIAWRDLVRRAVA